MYKQKGICLRADIMISMQTGVCLRADIVIYKQKDMCLRSTPWYTGRQVELEGTLALDGIWKLKVHP